VGLGSDRISAMELFPASGGETITRRHLSGQTRSSSELQKPLKNSVSFPFR
jgi:hypothetical protein